MKPVCVDSVPATYKQRTDWYFSRWFDRHVFVFGTQAAAVAFAVENRESANDYVSWIPRDNRSLVEKIGSGCVITDMRERTVTV